MGKKRMAIVFVLAGIFCICYGLFVAMVNSGSRFYLMWAAAGICLLGSAFLVHFGMWDRAPVIIKRALAVGLLAGAALFVIVEGCILSRFHDKGRKDLDYIIVLGAQIKPEGPSRVLQYRLDAAYDYLTENKSALCILSGGQGRNEPCSEAEGMYRYLADKGIAPQRLILEDRSTDTSENIACSMALIGRTDAKVGIVTNNFHVFRGVRLAKAAGLTDVCGIAARSDPLFQLNNMVREFFGVVKDTVCGNMF